VTGVHWSLVPFDPDSPTSPGLSPDAAGRRDDTGFRAVAAGDSLGRYQLLAPIGEGGMATVYRARDPELRREVAIKVLFPHLARRHDVVRRFHREARAAARLRHSAILQTFDVGGGEDGEPPYIVMELVRGPTLHEQLAQSGPMLSELVACVGVVIAEALEVAHQAGVIHRDLKPANLLIAEDGRLLLADFGVAHVDRDESLATRTGAVLGTPAYMSPEQASGEDIDVRSDLYSLGATLYHLATGVVPYSGSPMKVMSQLATAGSLVPPQQRRPAVGRPLSSAILQLMSYEPSQRPSTAKEAALAMQSQCAIFADPAAALAAYWRDGEAFLAAEQPRVLTALLEDAQRLRGTGKLAAAIALADRAVALAPNDERVTALVQAVTSRAPHQLSRRIRWVTAAVVSGGAVVAALTMWPTSPTSPASPAGQPARGIDASVDAVERAAPASLPTPERDAMSRVTTVDAATRVAPVRVAPVRVGSRLDGSGTALGTDAGSGREVGPDAGAVLPPVALPGAATFQMDAWCDLSIDGVTYGRADRARAVALSAGTHNAECSQGPGLGRWSGAIEVPAGQAVRISGELRMEVAVTIEVAGTSVAIGALSIGNHQRVALRNGRHRVTVRDGERELQSGWVSIPRVARCTLRDQPVLDCYP
jgi:hypothetical protein